MRKLHLFALILGIIMFTGIICLALYAFVPDAKAGMDYYLGPTGQNIAIGLSGAWISLVNSDFWITYIAPPINTFIIIFTTGVLATVFIFNPLKDIWTGFWAARHKTGIPIKTGTIMSTGGGELRSSTPVGATTRPTVQETPVVVVQQPVVEEKKEESATS